MLNLQSKKRTAEPEANGAAEPEQKKKKKKKSATADAADTVAETADTLAALAASDLPVQEETDGAEAVDPAEKKNLRLSFGRGSLPISTPGLVHLVWYICCLRKFWLAHVSVLLQRPNPRRRRQSGILMEQQLLQKLRPRQLLTNPRCEHTPHVPHPVILHLLAVCQYAYHMVALWQVPPPLK